MGADHLALYVAQHLPVLIACGMPASDGLLLLDLLDDGYHGLQVFSRRCRLVCSRDSLSYRSWESVGFSPPQ